MLQETREILQAENAEQRTIMLMALDAEKLKAVKREITAEMGLGTKPINPEIAKLDARKAELAQNPDVIEYIEIITELKKLRGRTIIPGWSKYRHDSEYRIIELHNGEVVDTDMDGWRKAMHEAGYRPGQTAMVSKGKKAAKEGTIYKNTLNNA